MYAVRTEKRQVQEHATKDSIKHTAASPKKSTKIIMYIYLAGKFQQCVVYCTDLYLHWEMIPAIINTYLILESHMYSQFPMLHCIHCMGFKLTSIHTQKTEQRAITSSFASTRSTLNW
jgi:hypothetical protein